MEPLRPGPANMLPAIDLSSTPSLDSYLAFKQQEARWKRNCSDLHKLWCLCGNYLNHFADKTRPLCGEEDGLVGGDVAGDVVHTTHDLDDGVADEELLAIADK